MTAQVGSRLSPTLPRSLTSAKRLANVHSEKCCLVWAPCRGRNGRERMKVALEANSYEDDRRLFSDNTPQLPLLIRPRHFKNVSIPEPIAGSEQFIGVHGPVIGRLVEQNQSQPECRTE